MKFSLADHSDGNIIHSYQDSQIVIRGQAYDSSLIVMSDRIIEKWRPQRFEDLVAEDFKQLTSLKPDMVLLGTGGRQAFPSPELYFNMISSGIGIEFMTTAAACRTYNVLLSEGRNIAAALLISQEPVRDQGS